jgi:hypothetical protein
LLIVVRPRSSACLVDLVRFGNTQLSHVFWFGSHVLQRQFYLLLFCRQLPAPSSLHERTGQIIGLSNSVAATIRLIETAIASLNAHDRDQI